MIHILAHLPSEILSDKIGLYFIFARHFLTSCTRVLGIECSSDAIDACQDAGGALGGKLGQGAKDRLPLPGQG